MPIRNSLGDKSVKETGFTRRMLAAAIKVAKAEIKDAEEFGTNEDELRRQHGYLAWLEKHQRHEGTVELSMR